MSLSDTLPHLRALVRRLPYVERVRVVLSGHAEEQGRPAEPCPHCHGRRAERMAWWLLLVGVCRHCAGTGTATVWRR